MRQAQSGYHYSTRLFRIASPVNREQPPAPAYRRSNRKLKLIPLICSIFLLLWLLLQVFGLTDLWPLLAIPIAVSAWFFYEAGAVVALTGSSALLAQAPLEKSQTLLVALSTFVALSLLLGRGQRQQREAHHQTLRSSVLDALTGLYNYGHFMDCLEREVRRVDRYGGLLTLVMFDLDRFKHFNDRFGHQAGNLALQAAGETLQREKRDSDIVARFGGEEFVLLLPGDQQAGLETAERLRQAIAQIRVPIAGNATAGITVSAGVVCYPWQAASQQELLERVDQLLYLSKKQGRNRVSVARDDGRRRLAAI